MPKENRRRGKRQEKKRLREQYERRQIVYPSKRARIEEEEGNQQIWLTGDSSGALERQSFDTAAAHLPGEVVFHGLLDTEEQAYFKNADTLLEANQFENAEDKELFVASVYREANGKELKIANSQSCSRLMERLILVSTVSQLKGLFQKFSGHFLQLVQHRFASHCCETLFLQSAPIVTQELLQLPSEESTATENDDLYVPMERLFLSAVNELQGNTGYLMTEKFGSHALRVLLLVLSGRPLTGSAANHVLQSKSKEGIVSGQQNSSSQEGPHRVALRTVPESFSDALKGMRAGMISMLNTTYLRALATHPIGNPVLQLLLEIEFAKSDNGKATDPILLFHRLVEGDIFLQDDTNVQFIASLMYDPVGSRLLETIVQHTPGKIFKPIYRRAIKEKLETLVKNETAGFVIIKALERLSKDDLQHAMEKICPLIGVLVKRSRTSLIRTLIERCYVRQVGTEPISQAILEAYQSQDDNILVRMLNIASDPTLAGDRPQQSEKKDSAILHTSLLAQTMLEQPGPLCELVTRGLGMLSLESLVILAKDRTSSYILQKALTNPDQDATFLRKILRQLRTHLIELTLHPIGSHVIDTFWFATTRLQFLREQIADDLLKQEAALRDSRYGRSVWRNLNMDLYKNRRFDWKTLAKRKDHPGSNNLKYPAA
ncbi:MAG: Nucleolar protein 9 [Icmadophila ericetorum]|nr:Nucleolar protein 9 [Icmadophila ericetorum]